MRDNGQQLASGVPINPKNIVQDNPFERAPDREDYEGFTGNEGASATHFYRNSCIVMIPRKQHVDFLLDHAQCGDVDMEAWLRPMIEEVEQRPGDARREAELIEICQQVVKACIAKRRDEQAGYRWYIYRDLQQSSLDSGYTTISSIHLLPTVSQITWQRVRGFSIPEMVEYFKFSAEGGDV